MAPLPTLPTPELSMLVDRYPEYPANWLELTEEHQRDCLLPTHAANVPSRPTYPLTGEEKQATSTAPEYVYGLCGHHEHGNIVHGLKDLLLAQKQRFGHQETGNAGVNRPYLFRKCVCVC